MRIEINGRKIVDVGHFINCVDCPLDTNEPKCLAQLLGLMKSCETGFKYEDNI